ncbi:flavodoxin [Lentisphaerota bacterium ZTH]|nr:flavodoxin [Lentisphaerota bacterium]WET05467.1 flavodoxin [Lentisphaerota bacterium ZTH]
MANVAIIYGSTTGNTQSAAEKIQAQFGADAVLLEAATVSAADLKDYDVLILGSSTWGIGELQDDWVSVDWLDGADLNGKKVAFFGCGDQAGFGDSFVDALGILKDKLASSGASFIGAWPVDGYDFSGSTAVEGDHFVGLPLDEENQSDLTDERIAQWVEQLKGEI